MAEALICTQNWLKPSFVDFKDLNLSEEYELLENVVAVLSGVHVGPASPAVGVGPATGL
ncbi:hypothetical protein MtrunA17_Chr3g0101291 [Medicago truncatula]|uniref:Uncharacterized protein n=1 Tax=Medicago truncatula TaxID=3880 RepID=A0A396IRL3_MEDTR|nr:hypothetical protein MtrunA17_Chr3g0101291 [Medicago truncatula]